jgi:hypothetical protein
MHALLLISSLTFAQDPFELDPLFDTGGPEEQLYDPEPLWPSKVITDAVNQNILLIWFEQQPARTISIPFSEIKEFRVIPQDEDLLEEVQLHTTTGKKFLVAIGPQAGVNTQTTCIVAGFIPIRGRQSEKHIQSSPAIPRATPLLQMGKSDDPNALIDPSTLSSTLPLDVTPIEPNTTLMQMGEDPSSIAGNGTLGKSDINRVIINDMNRFRACYQREFQKDPTLEGEIVIQFSIDKDGSIKGAKVKDSSLSNIIVEQCILRNFMSLRFTPPSGGMATPIINYPFIFSSGN